MIIQYYLLYIIYYKRNGTKYQIHIKKQQIGILTSNISIYNSNFGYFPIIYQLYTTICILLLVSQN